MSGVAAAGARGRVGVALPRRNETSAGAYIRPDDTRRRAVRPQLCVGVFAPAWPAAVPAGGAAECAAVQVVRRTLGVGQACNARRAILCVGVADHLPGAIAFLERAVAFIVLGGGETYKIGFATMLDIIRLEFRSVTTAGFGFDSLKNAVPVIITAEVSSPRAAFDVQNPCATVLVGVAFTAGFLIGAVVVRVGVDANPIAAEPVGVRVTGLRGVVYRVLIPFAIIVRPFLIGGTVAALHLGGAVVRRAGRPCVNDARGTG